MDIEDKVDAFVVSNSSYYRERFNRFLERDGFVATFNLAACALGPIWLVYRKLYVPLFWAVLVLAADVLLWLYVDDRQLVSSGLSWAWSWSATILFLGVIGCAGNYWYWRRYRKVEGQAVAMHADREGQLQHLRSKGGTAPIVTWLIVVVLLAPTLWAGYWAYQGFRAGVILDATGPMTLGEIQANYLQFMDEPLTGPRQECVHREIEDRARAAGDPERLNPATVEGLRADDWERLDSHDKRFELGVAIVTRALQDCFRPETRQRATSTSKTAVPGGPQPIVAGEPRFDVFERSNSAGDGTFASADGTVLLSFLATDRRYCRAARFRSDHTVVLACRNENGWDVEAASSLAPGESTVATAFGGGAMTEVTEAIRTLNPGARFLNEREIVEAAGNGWRYRSDTRGGR